jgi:hypothetical protein
MQVSFHADVETSKRRAIEASLAGLGLLADLIRWGMARSPRRMIADVVVQDEYTHDVVMRYDDELVLVFDTT